MREEISAFRQQVGKIGGVMHCWTGNPEETQWFLDLGFYISFSGIVTFKNSKTVQAAAQIVPSDRLLIETDCPFLSPESPPLVNPRTLFRLPCSRNRRPSVRRIRSKP
jgi:TatD DNase family protein